jgi:hypothetical protein
MQRSPSQAVIPSQGSRLKGSSAQICGMDTLSAWQSPTHGAGHDSDTIKRSPPTSLFLFFWFFVSRAQAPGHQLPVHTRGAFGEELPACARPVCLESLPLPFVDRALHSARPISGRECASWSGCISSAQG